MLKLKADWETYLHQLRSREIEAIFRDCPPKAFRRGLELGAGDAFQSSLLENYVDELVVTDFSDQILAHPDTPHRIHRVCDAEEVDQTFGAGEFDLVFSSNMMEHVPNPRRALTGIHNVLKDDGIAIHVMPSQFWKVCHMAGFHVDAVLTRLERYSAGRLPRLGTAWSESVPMDGNNLKLGDERSHGRLRRLVWPVPHGVSRSNWKEFLVFHRKAWEGELESAGFDLISTLRGPVSSGYGFGLDRARGVLERIGAASEFVYVTSKNERESLYAPYFRRGAAPKGPLSLESE